MRGVEISEDQLRAIREHARETYPDECCGFLVIRSEPAEGSTRQVVRVERARNEVEGERRRRFVIGAAELREVEARLASDGLTVGGFYHSHPDHPALPSEFDREHAWPWYSYLVLGVTRTSEGPLGAFELDADSGSFVPTAVTPSPNVEWPDRKRRPKSALRDEGVP